MECTERNLITRVIWSRAFWPFVTWNLRKAKRWNVLTFDRCRPHSVTFGFSKKLITYYFSKKLLTCIFHFHFSSSTTPRYLIHVTPVKKLPITSKKLQVINCVACENIRFSSLFDAGDVSRGGTSATQRQKVHSNDAKSVRNPVRSADWSME